MSVLRHASIYLPLLLVCLGAKAASAQKTFEVVSIHENASPSGPQSGGPTPDGYRIVNRPLTIPVRTAYGSSTGTGDRMDTVIDIQKLMNTPNYDIDARVSEADRADWQDPKKQPEMLREMLQAMLADRFHLRVHSEVRTQDIYLLQLAKGGPKFPETKPGEEHPGAVSIPGGGYASSNGGVFRYYDLPMSALASVISSWTGRAVHDDTGLPGRYDVSFPRPSFANNTSTDPSIDADPTIFSVLAGLGLRLASGNGQVETVVIDHIEPPTAN
jgi:bla regulator protein blaR1